MRRKLIIGAAVIAVCLGAIVTRAMWEGRSALSRGDAAAREGDSTEAVRWWRRAARWYVPGASHVDDAYRRLAREAERAEAAGDADGALLAWRAIRRSAIATRSVFSPHREHLARANRRIAALMAEAPGQTYAGDTAAEREKFHAELLERPVGPSVGWTLVAVLGLLLWLGGSFGFALRGLDRHDRLRKRAASSAAAIIALGLVIWMIGLYKA